MFVCEFEGQKDTDRDLVRRKWEREYMQAHIKDMNTNLNICVCACWCVHAHGSIQQAERQEALLWGAGTAVLIKAQAGDTMGGVPLFIHQPPLPFGRVR